MRIVVIYKQDGTLQCMSEPKLIPLAHEEALLRQAGVQEICASGNVLGPRPVPSGCKLPTAQVNAFAISADDWQRLQESIVGTLGFQLWLGAPLPDLGWSSHCTVHPGPLPIALRDVTGSVPVLTRELLGRPCRCYRLGDSLAEDFIPERVNLEMDADDRILRIWLG